MHRSATGLALCTAAAGLASVMLAIRNTAVRRTLIRSLASASFTTPPPPPHIKKVKIALCQILSSDDKAQNIEVACKAVRVSETRSNFTQRNRCVVLASISRVCYTEYMPTCGSMRHPLSPTFLLLYPSWHVHSQRHLMEPSSLFYLRCGTAPTRTTRFQNTLKTLTVETVHL
jgi:hypothetical protein